MFIKKDLIILFLIFLLGVFWRFFLLGSNPPSLYWDEVAIGLDAYSLSTTGGDINGYSPYQAIFLSYGDYKAPVYIWLTILPVKFWGLTNFAIRFPAAVVGSLLVILVYFLVKELFREEKIAFNKETLALVSALLVAISPWAVHFSRIGFESGLSLFWLSLSLLLFIKGLKFSPLYLIFSTLTAIIGIYSYFVLRFLLPLLFLGVAFIYRQEILRKKYWFLVSLALGLILIWPLFASPFYSPSQTYRLSNQNIFNNSELIQESSRYLERYHSSFLAKLFYHRYWFIGRDFLKNYTSHFSFEFLFLNGDPNLRHHTGYGGELLIFCLPFLILGIYVLMKNINRRSFQVIGAWLFLAPVVASISYEVPHASRAIYLLLPLVTVVSLGINQMINLFKIKWLIYAGLILGLGINFGFYIHDYWQHYSRRSSQDWIYAYQQMAEYVAQNRQNFNFVKVTEKYWLPQLYLLYQMPELLLEIQKNKTSSGEVDLSLTHVLQLTNKNSLDKPKVSFLVPDEAPGQTKTIQNFYFLDGQQALFLTTEK